MFSNDVIDNGFVSKIQKQLMQLNIKKKKIKTRGEDLQRHFSKEDMQRAKRHMKRYSSVPVIGAMKIKTIMRLSPYPSQSG